MIEDEKPVVCRQVWDRAVESPSGRDVMEDAALAAHVGSCVTCFRTLAELRDAPRLAAALRAEAPAVPVSDRFWDDLAARTTDAAAAALRGTTRRRSWRLAGLAATITAAAAAWVLVARHGPVGSGSGGISGPQPVAVTAGGDDDEAADEAVDVADLDASALRQLLARLRARASVNISALAAAGDVQDGADSGFDDDGVVNDELAELDRPALLRVERSLAGAAL